MTTKTQTVNPNTYPRDKLPWRIPNEVFVDGSRLSDWERIESFPWLPQERGYELSFAIYQHDGQFWKLYQARWRVNEDSDYRYSYGGLACRMAEVRYIAEASSPHSHAPMGAGDREWVRVEEVDTTIHELLRRGIG